MPRTSARYSSGESGIAPVDVFSAGTVTSLNGNGTATKTGTVITLGLTDPQTGNYVPADWTGPRVIVNNFVDFSGSVRIYARLVTISGDNTTFGWFGIVSEADSYFRGFRIRADNGAVQTRSDGGALTNPGFIPVDGTGWVAYDRTGATSNWYFGTGTESAPPLNWTWGYSVGDSAPPQNGLSMALGKQNTGVVGSVVWNNIYYERV